MRTQKTRDRLVGIRVTQHERALLRQVAAADERTVTGFLRKLLADSVMGFGATKRERRAEGKETNR
jgi:hypothetical protein